MTYRVVLLEKAISDVARDYVPLWGTDEAKRITETLARVDLWLSANPTQYGESRGGRKRFLVEMPLSLHFEVHDDQLVVVVTGVKYHPPRHGPGN